MNRFGDDLCAPVSVLPGVPLSDVAASRQRPRSVDDALLPAICKAFVRDGEGQGVGLAIAAGTPAGKTIEAGRPQAERL